MKKSFIPTLATLLAAASLAGCAWHVGGGPKSAVQPTIGQQLIDLQKARDAGVITDAEYQSQKTRLLGSP